MTSMTEMTGAVTTTPTTTLLKMALTTMKTATTTKNIMKNMTISKN